MQKRKNTKSKLIDASFIFFCILGAFLSIWMFRKELNKALYKLNEEPIATITFKYKTAQRKFLDKMIWDRLKQNSPVYEGDTVRIAPLSEATVYFTDGNIMELYENTLARLSLQENSAFVDFDFGRINVHSNENGMKIKSGKTILNIEENSTASTFSEEANPGKLNILVTEGNASLSANGKNHQITKDTANVFDSSLDTVSLSSLSVRFPKPEAKYLNYKNEKLNIPFEWSVLRDGNESNKNDDVTLVVSSSKDFSKVEETYTFSKTNKANVKLDSGIHYYKLSYSDQEIEGRINILYAPTPKLVSPAQNLVTKYRTRKPSIRFIWTESKYATSYELEIADNERMENPIIKQRTPLTSSIITTLTEGKYFYRVKPFFTINNVGFAESSNIQSFVIEQSGQMPPVSLVLPSDKGLVNTKVNGKNTNVNFSWKDNIEAASYTVKISSFDDMSNPLIDEIVTDNYLKIDPEKRGLKNGKYFYCVSASDAEGNTVLSETRSFLALDADLEQRTLFPPDGYKIASSRTQDTRYIWKTNVPFATVFELSNNKDFSDILIQENISNLSRAGRSLQTGTYFWRIATEIDGIKINTNAKSLIVEPPLSKPECIAPVNASRAVVRPETPYSFEWTLVEDADYYQLKLYDISNKEKPVYEKNFIENTKVLVDMERFDEKKYSWTIQAFREETPLASRSSGFLGEYGFALKKLKPIELLEPKNGLSINGVNAIKKPGTLLWNAVDIPKNSTLLLYKNEINDENLVLKIENPQYKIQLPRLYEGEYFWTVKGYTLDDLDISAKKENTFTVTPVEKLPEVKTITPKNETVFDTTYFRNNRNIKFAWNKVSGADEYLLCIYKEDNAKIFKKKNALLLEKKLSRDELSFTLENLSILTRGRFIYTVEARSLFEGDLFQNGKITENKFEIDLPEIKKPTLKNTGTLYGK